MPLHGAISITHCSVIVILNDRYRRIPQQRRRTVQIMPSRSVFRVLFSGFQFLCSVPERGCHFRVPYTVFSHSGTLWRSDVLAFRCSSFRTFWCSGVLSNGVSIRTSAGILQSESASALSQSQRIVTVGHVPRVRSSPSPRLHDILICRAALGIWKFQL